MPVFTIQAPDGRKIKIEAADQATAIRGAQEWAQANPAGKAAAKKPAPQPPAKRPSLAQEFTGAMANLNRGLGIADEMQGAMMTVEDAFRGNVRGSNPLALARSVGQNFSENMNVLRRQEDEFSARRPATANVLRGTGAGATIFAPGAAGTQVVRGGNMAMNALRGGVSAAASAGVYGLADRGTLQERANAANRAMAVAGPLGAAVGAVAGRASRAARQPVPTSDGLRATRSAAYQAADQAGVRYSPQAYDDLVTSVQQDLAQARLNPMRHPRAASMLEDMQGLRGQAPTLTELDQLRQVVRRDVANATDEAERFMGQRIIAQIDQFIDNATPAQVVSGSADDAARLIGQARDANTRFRKVEAVEEGLEKARLRAGSTGSGGNVDNATRQEMRRILENTPNLTAQEREALERIVMGGQGQNLLRLVGKLSPSGNGLMAAGNLGSAAAFGPLGAIPGFAGLASKMGADAITRRNVEALIRLMSGQAPQAARAASPAAGQVAARATRGVGVGAVAAQPGP